MKRPDKAEKCGHGTNIGFNTSEVEVPTYWDGTSAQPEAELPTYPTLLELEFTIDSCG